MAGPDPLSSPPGRRPVYLAARGVACAAGITPDEVAAALIAGQVPAGMLDTGNSRVPYASLPAEHFPLPSVTGADWLTRARAAVDAAAGSAARPWSSLPPQTPLFIASSSFQLGALESQRHPELPTPYGRFAAPLARWLGFTGPCAAFSNACVSSFSALDAACRLIGSGQAHDVVILGIELANRSTAAGFSAMALLSPAACRPLDRDRDGLVLGEGVALLHLSARPGPWEIAGLVSGLDAATLTGPTPDGGPLAVLMTEAIARARLAPADIDLVKLQAAGSPTNDLAEAHALHRVFRDACPPLVSLKPALGHTLGASGAIELAALLACLDRGVIPPTPGFATPDPAIGLQPTRQALQSPTPCAMRHALLNLIGFGGGAASLVVRRR